MHEDEMEEFLKAMEEKEKKDREESESDLMRKFRESCNPRRPTEAEARAAARRRKWGHPKKVSWSTKDGYMKTFEQVERECKELEEQEF